MDFPLKGRVVSTEEIKSRMAFDTETNSGKTRCFSFVELTNPEPVRTAEGLIKISRLVQQFNRQQTYSMLSFLSASVGMPRLCMRPVEKENEDDHLILLRYTEGTPTHTYSFEKGKQRYSMPFIPVIGLVVKTEDIKAVLEEAKQFRGFNNAVEVEYFDDESFLDIHPIN